jgi:hypothetical protein
MQPCYIILWSLISNIFVSASYEKAAKKLKQAEETDNLETTQDEGDDDERSVGQGKRKKKCVYNGHNF